jgi:hypothetical protein
VVKVFFVFARAIISLRGIIHDKQAVARNER